jgi:tryptophan synthase beta chain
MRRASRRPGGGLPGVLQGTYSYVLQNDAGQVATTHSVSAGLDYASVGPEHAMLHDSGRATYTSATDAEALAATSRWRGRRGFCRRWRARMRWRRR